MTVLAAAAAAQAGFWPHTLGSWAAIAATVTGAIAAAFSYRNHGKLDTVRVLVNGTLSRIERELRDTAAERDRLKYARGVMVGGRRRTDPAPLPDIEKDPTP